MLTEAVRANPPPQEAAADKILIHQSDSSKDIGLPLVVALFLFAVCAPVSFSVGSLSLTPIRLLLIPVIIKSSIDLLRGKFGPILFVDVIFFLHVVWIVLALSRNNPDRVVEFAGSTALEFMGGYLIGRGYIRCPASFLKLIRTLTFLIIFLLPFAVIEAVFNRPLILEIWDKVPGVRTLPNSSMGTRFGLDRVQVMLPHPILFGLFASSVFSLCVIGLQGLYSNFARLLSGFAILTCVFLSLSGGAYMSIMLQIALITWAFLFSNVKVRWLLLFGFACVLYIVVDLLSNRTPVMVFLHYLTFSPDTAYWRTIIFSVGMENVWANPLFGVGLNEWVRPRWMRSGSMDNFWLVMAVRYGIPGFLTVAIPYIWAVWKISRRNFDQNAVLWRLRRAWVFTFFGLSFTLTTVHIWAASYSFIFFLFGAGMWMITSTGEAGASSEAAKESGSGPALEGRSAYARKSPVGPAGSSMPPLTRFPKRQDKSAPSTRKKAD